MLRLRHLTILLAFWALCAAVVVADARAAVQLDGASFAASLRPGQSVVVWPQCPGRAVFSDVHAVRSDGSPLYSAQAWTRDGLTYWRGRHGRVTFDGLVFRNRTHARVWVAGWCEGERLPLPAPPLDRAPAPVDDGSHVVVQTVPMGTIDNAPPREVTP